VYPFFRLLLSAGLVFVLCSPAVVQAQAKDKKGGKEAPKEKKVAPKEEAPKEKKKEAPKEEAPKLDAAAKEAMQSRLHNAEEEYRLYFRRPKTVPEFWSALTYEMDVGKFDIAALFLDQLLKKQPAAAVDQDLAQIEEAKGMSAFLRLLDVRRWDKNPTLEEEARSNVRTLIKRVTDAVERRLSDPVRLNKLIGSLSARTREERDFALAQLKRSNDRATPYFVDALRRTAGTPEEDRIKDAMTRLDSGAMLPLREVLRARSAKDAQDVDLRLAILDVIARRGDKRFVPDLWYLSASRYYPPLVRQRARAVLAGLLHSEVERLPSAKEVLTEQAERHYRHQVKYTDPKRVRLWSWNGRELARHPVALTAGLADQYYSQLFADEALDLDPAYRPAQEVYLDVMLSGTFAQNLGQALEKKLPGALHRLLARLDTDLLSRTLEHALTERNEAVILPLVRILGERGDVQATQSFGGQPRGLLRALYYPDRRVQMAAVRAILRLPSTPEPATAARVVDILRRFVAAAPTPVALLVGVPDTRLKDVRKAIQGAGFEPVFAARPQEALQRLEAAADVDVILVYNAGLPGDWPYFVAQLRADRNVGLLPLWLLFTSQTKETMTALARRHLNTWAVPEGLLTMPDELKGRLEEAIKLALAPAWVQQLPPSQRSWVESDLKRTSGLKISTAERKAFTREAMDDLSAMARGQIRGYDLAPARAAVENVLHSPELGPEAIVILGRLPSREVQQRLALLALDSSAGKLRLPAAIELNRHVRANGLLLTAPQLFDMQRAATNPKEEVSLRSEFALVLGQRGSSSRLSGERLRHYTPDVPAPPPQKKK
jgi:CheY-like chemotaxis protein